MSFLEATKACFYFPTKVVFLDDNEVFLNALELEFGNQDNMMMFTCPDKARDAIVKGEAYLLQRHLMDETGSDDNETANHIPGFNLNKIVSMIYEYSRLNTVSVLVVDYEMPEVNGVEFCKKLEDKNIFKILLTAEADTSLAVDAFNAGTIDKFILKTSDDLYTKVLDAIVELKHKYFKELSKVIIQSCGIPLKVLMNTSSYNNIFNEILVKSQAKEYYMIDRCGSFLFLDKFLMPTWLIVCDQNKRNDQISLLEGLDSQDSLIEQIKNRDKILFLFSDNEYKESVTDWGKYVFNSTKLDDIYNYSIIENRIVDSIKWNCIESYQP